MTTKSAVVTGISGQDGWHLATLLIRQGYQVVGTTRGTAGTFDTLPVELVQWDLRDHSLIADLIRRVQPAEFYNCAAYTSGEGMFDDPVEIGDINGLAVTRILEVIRTL